MDALLKVKPRGRMGSVSITFSGFKSAVGGRLGSRWDGRR